MKNEYVVGLSIDKVQTYLTEAIHSHVQEKQTEGDTLLQIMGASLDISEGFYEAVQNQFSGKEEKVLMSCSGVYIFTCKAGEAEICEKLNELFVQYYKRSEGKKLLRYVYFLYQNNDEIWAIQQAKKELKQSDSFGRIIEKNKEVLFQFCQEKPADIPFVKEPHTMFATDINNLFHPEDGENPHTEKTNNNFPIAVIKADLDGMGAMFKNINEYDTYQKTSKVLSNYVSLSKLHSAAKACHPRNRKGWLFPFYIAGDDIFFAVAVANLVEGVNVCKTLLQKIKKALPDANLSKQLSMSIGIEITYNRQPIRYYLEMVDAQLKKAKETSCPNALQPFLDTKIAIGGLTFLDIHYQDVKLAKKALPGKTNADKREMNKELKDILVWQYFLNDINFLFSIRQKYGDCNLIGQPSFFYSLLEKLTGSEVQNNPARYINYLLYQLLPKYLESAGEELWKEELVLNAGIIKQLYVKKDKGREIQLCEDTQRRLERYLRLMLLFADPRFTIAKHHQKDKSSLHAIRIEEAKKLLLTKVIDYLYEHLSAKPLCKVFITSHTFTPKPDKKSYKKAISKIPYYRTVRIEKSMFIKLRDTAKIPIDKAAEMLALNNREKSEVSEKDKPIYSMNFDIAGFLQKAANKKTWNTDFVDALMLFYEYNKAFRKYKNRTEPK